MMSDMDLAFYESRKTIDRNDIDTEVAEHHELWGHVAREAARAHSRLKQLEARLYKETVDGALALNAKVPSVAAFERAVWLNSEYQDAVEEHKDWEILADTFKARGFALRELVDLTTSGYLASDTIAAGGSSRRDARERKAAEMRARQKEQRDKRKPLKKATKKASKKVVRKPSKRRAV